MSENVGERIDQIERASQVLVQGWRSSKALDVHALAQLESSVYAIWQTLRVRREGL